MNAIEMIYQFEQYLGTLDATLQKPKTADTLDFLNIAQDDAHQELYNVLDTSEQAKKVMAPFIYMDTEITSFTAYTGSMPNAKRVVLPTDLQYVLREELQVNVDEFGRIAPANGPTVRPVKPITIDEYNANKDNPFRKPYYDESWRIDAKYFVDVSATNPEHLLIMAPEIVPITYYLSYVKSMVPLTQDISSVSEFPDWYHDNVVKRAVSLYARSRSAIEPEREPEKA